MRTLPLIAALTLIFAAHPGKAQMPAGPTAASTKSLPAGILNREQSAAILPATVFFAGQTATIQGRNSGGIKLPDGKLILFGVVDTAGYSSAIQQKYQAYLITEVPIALSDRRLPPGSYGFGFVDNNQMVVMDVGGNEVLRAATTRDAALGRPTPLQVLPDSPPGRFRLYLGRSYVPFGPAAK